MEQKYAINTDYKNFELINDKQEKPKLSDEELQKIMDNAYDKYMNYFDKYVVHKKTRKAYYVLKLALNEEDLEPVVIYTPTMGASFVWVRKLDDFIKAFEKI